MDVEIVIDRRSFSKQLIVIMIVITIVQYVLINKIIYNQQNVKLTERIKFNLANQEDIEKTISEDLQKRLSLLYTAKDEGSDHKLKYNDWIEYTIKSPYVYVNKENDIKYFIQIWRKIEGVENGYKLRAYPDSKFINHEWTDLYDYIDSVFTSKHTTTSKHLLSTWEKLKAEPYSVLQFYWYDPVFDSMVERKEIIYNYDDGLGNKGMISAGYTLKDINEEYTFSHFKDKDGSIRNIYTFSVISTYILTLLIYAFNKENGTIAFFKSLLFFIIFMGYITYYITLEDQLGSTDIELKKLDSINQGVLSMSFMTGLSVFILSNIKETKPFLYRETSFLLIAYMIAIILILFKNNSYIKLRDITRHRVFKEFTFNYCILINMFIVINFGLNVFLYGLESNSNNTGKKSNSESTDFSNPVGLNPLK